MSPKIEPMEDLIKQDILEVLKKAQLFLKDNRYKDMKKLSEVTITDASIFQDHNSITIAVIIYAVSKLMEQKITTEFFEQMESLLNAAEQFLRSDDIKGYQDSIENIGFLISTFDDKFRMYIEKVMEKSQVKKASGIHSGGISIARTAQMLGIGQWELMSYVGKTKVHDEFDVSSDVKTRINFVRSLFN
ncbi:hypothetical protein HOK51_06325 [Candidatus Woesearchaeota archaeon]|jgi:hypothetical protein|nr:hypothetical protein [Candidatus Woesearchaeota archaeon]MBT6519440.1 hypothetical protein [Candidatus Woesearchaeota archaeon]MBT7368898.1 hypothetical protein [Candidatus Woesearchaeota archaeon]